MSGVIGNILSAPESDEIKCAKCNGIWFPYAAGDSEGSCGADAPIYYGYFFMYVFLLAYAFGGVAVAADLFMGSIEAVTAVSKKVKRKDGSTIEILVWNKTVSNLSLMALGSSAPEIMLAVIEVIGNDFNAGALGPGTIVGSAAFNMLMIIAICVSIEPLKKVEEINVLYITTFFSVFAYVWLYIIVEVWHDDSGMTEDQIVDGKSNWKTEGDISITECVITCLFFPLLLVVAWAADKGWFDSDVVSHTIKRTLTSTAGAREDRMALERVVAVGGMAVRANGTSEWNKEFRKALKKHANENKTMKRDEVYVLAFEEMKHHHHAPVLAAANGQGDTEVIEMPDEAGGRYIQRRNSLTGEHVGPTVIGFAASAYESSKEGTVDLNVMCVGTHAEPIVVRWKTSAGTAKIGTHYEEGAGSITFPATDADALHSTIKTPLNLSIHASPEFDLSKYFSVELECAADIAWMNGLQKAEIEVKNLYEPTGTCDRITKGLSHFWLSVTGEDEADNAWYEQIRLSFRFDEDDDDDDDEDGTSINPNAPVLDYELPEVTLKLTKVADDVGGAPIEESSTDEGGGDDDKGHGFFDWFIYLYMIVPKVLMAFTCPPIEWGNGWFTFGFSLAWIGVYTLICGDLATGLGCTCGLKDAVTAITFVALGTSVPDTFASKIAAEQDKNADPAIGNVTGSNAVNVFLGVGISWLVGAIYHSTDASPDDRKQLRIAGGSLGFSVVLFSIFAVIWFAILMARRVFLGGELGGPEPWKTLTWGTFTLMWIAFITLSGLKEYEHIFAEDAVNYCNMGTGGWAVDTEGIDSYCCAGFEYQINGTGAACRSTPEGDADEFCVCTSV